MEFTWTDLTRNDYLRLYWRIQNDQWFMECVHQGCDFSADPRFFQVKDMTCDLYKFIEKIFPMRGGVVFGIDRKVFEIVREW